MKTIRIDRLASKAGAHVCHDDVLSSRSSYNLVVMFTNYENCIKKAVLAFFVSLLLFGCASTKYGYTLEEWSSMTQQERDEARIQAENMVEYVDEKQREKKFLHQPVNVISGSRSNVY